MKRHLIAALVMGAVSMAQGHAAGTEPLTWQLSQGWRFHEARLDNWYPATVPGVVHTDLMANHIIDDPFLKLNERGVQWIDKEDWVYETRFDMPDDAMGREHIMLTCHGLDTYADVYLNDSLIIRADNMFRTWRADIKGLVKASGNTLRVFFHSPVKTDLPKYDALPYHYPASNDQSENGGLLDKKISPFARKAGYHYGWDWGPRLLTSGIWRPVTITAWSGVRIDNTYFMQPQVSRQVAHVREEVTIDATRGTTAVVSITDEATGHTHAKRQVTLREGSNKVVMDFKVRNPRLWWCNGYGDPHRYRFKTTVTTEKNRDERTDKIGLRSLRLVTDNDEAGQGFCFVLNGERIFMKGANYIPCDNFLTRVNDSVYRKTIDDAVAVHMNMLRVWGGGVYEDDRFYDLCDEKGILVWQDFMFACGMYPATGHYLDNIRQEAIDNVVRLRNHPRIALWCGNNECQDAWYNWGWKKAFERQSQTYADTLWSQFRRQYYEVLPAVVKACSPGTAYRPSSPFAGYGGGSKPTTGDYHYWEVWHGRKPISEYNRVRARFFSEYGMQSFPQFESVRRFAPDEKDWDIHSEVMMWHQRGGAHANSLIETYLESEYKKPGRFQDLLYVGQLMQGDAMRTAVEAHRRDKGYCWGTLLWQINDCWPVASWSTRDYYGRWKAAHYFMRRAMDDVLVSPVEKDGSLHVCLVSDRLKDVRGMLTVEVQRMDGTMVNRVSMTVTAQANSAGDALVIPVSELLKGCQRREVFIHVTFQADRTYESVCCLEVPKNMDFPQASIHREVSDAGDGIEVTLTADRFARGVFLSLPDHDYFFEDNYFDLLPGRPRTVRLSTPMTAAQVREQLRLVSLSDI